ncbi:hypothetical protein HK098_005005 [Nowakowskiella sp. JEL0407]|nr:hypothetical protein HK098_005005 [Nowakowskiella sp. JEL0407]
MSYSTSAGCQFLRTSVEDTDLLARKQSEILNRIPRPKELQERMLEQLQLYIEKDYRSGSLVTFYRLHPDYTGIRIDQLNFMLKSLEGGAKLGVVSRFAQWRNKITVIEMIDFVTKQFGVRRDSEYFNLLILCEMYLNRKQRALELWNEALDEGINLLEKTSARDNFRIIIPMIRGDRNAAYNEFEVWRRESPKSYLPFDRLMQAVEISSMDLGELDDVMNMSEIFSKQNGLLLKKDTFLRKARILSKLGEHRKVLNLYEKVSKLPRGSNHRARTLNNVVLDAIGSLQEKDRLELLLNLWMVDRESSFNIASYVRIFEIATEIVIHPHYILKISDVFYTLYLQEVHNFTLYYHFSTALTKSFGSNSTGNLLTAINEYHSKNACSVLTLPEMHVKLAASFAMRHDIHSLNQTLEPIESSYEKIATVQEMLLIMKAPLYSIEADDQQVILRAANQAVSHFSRAFYHYVNQKSVGHYTLANGILGQLIFYKLYGHARYVLSLYRKAGIKYWGYKLERHRNQFFVNDKGELMHVFDGFEDVIIGSYR